MISALFLFSAILSTILIMGFVCQAFAVQMTALLIPSKDSSQPAFTGVRFITLKYDPGSSLSKLLNGKSEHVTFTMKGTAGGMSEVISAFNNAIATQKQSPVRIENGTLTYSADLIGQPDSAQLSYKVDFNPTMTKFVLQKNGTQGAVVDLDWRSIVVNDPLIVNAPKYGKISANYPISLLEAIHPDLVGQFLNSKAADIMKSPLFNFEPVGIPMDRWHFLFDPTGSLAGVAGSGFTEQGGARAVSVYSLGESSFREGTFTEQTSDSTATIDNTPVQVHSSTPPPSAQLQIPGFARIQRSGNSELAFVSTQAPSGTVTATGSFPLQVLLVFGGMMGAVAVFVLVKARK
ncbi:MAG: hypothetical protein JO327_13520 [Nitrososphaeraceae archaeon]|nr:hypothetical protein [Nitrososphaeraceae archaeon]